jgi:hypothetical protein
MQRATGLEPVGMGEMAAHVACVHRHVDGQSFWRVAAEIWSKADQVQYFVKRYIAISVAS